MIMRLLLINPKTPESFWTFKWAVNEILPGKRAVNPPLGLATVAALSPADWDVRIIDENVEPLPDVIDADIIGIGGMGVQAKRQKELMALYRARGHYVVVGGAGASLCPENYEGLADSVISGEAEYIWPQFCRDFEAGTPQALYHETGTVELCDSPVPRFDLLQVKAYANATLQFSRGCPYTCEFCDIIVMFGRKPRMKAPEQIGRELDALLARGVTSIFFVDDNMIGNKKEAKKLLAYLVAYQRERGRPFSFGTEASINLAQDEELMGLMVAAGFHWVFIGIESPDPVSLKETGKTQNLREDMLTSVRRIHGRGLEILAGFIIGFDNDSEATFEQQYQFIMQSGIQTAMVGLLSAVPKTPLYERLERDGRLRKDIDEADNTQMRCNVIHPTMSEETIARLYSDIYRRLLSDHGIATRIHNKLAIMQEAKGADRGRRSGYSKVETLGLFWRLLTKGVLAGGPVRVYHFLKTLPYRHPALAPTVLADWITGLSMRRFANDHLWPAPDLLDHVQAALARYLRKGEIWVTRRSAELPSLNIRISHGLSLGFFRNSAPQLMKLMRQSHARLTLSIDALPSEYHQHLAKLLKRLAKHGDRVVLEISEATRARLGLDLSAFHLVTVA